MRRNRMISVAMSICLIIGLWVPNTKVHAQTLLDEQPDREMKTGLDEIEGTVEILDMTVEEYLAKLNGGKNKAPLMLNASGAGAFKLNSADDADELPVSSEYNGRFRYSQLSAPAKKLYDNAVEACKDFVLSAKYLSDISNEAEATIQVTYEGEPGEAISKSEAYNVMAALYYEEYSFYWMSNEISAVGCNNGGTVTIKISPEFYTYESRRTVDETLADVIAEWYDELNTIYTDEELGQEAKYYTVLKLHDLIINRIDYAYDSNNKPQNARWAHSLAGIGTGQGVVCEGYAKMFAYMLNILGIDNLFVTGDGGGEGHAWNAVCLDEGAGPAGYYLCDLTWDDPGTENASGLNQAEYFYFCMPSNLFDKKHTADTSAVWPSFSKSSDYSFYKYFKSYADEALNDAAALTLRDSGLGNQYAGSDFVFYVVPDYDSVVLLRDALGDLIAASGTGSTAWLSCYTSPWGMMLKYESVQVSVPAEEIVIIEALTDEIPASPTAIEVRGTHSFTAQISEMSDDRVSWSVSDPKVATVLSNGRTVTVRGRKNGEVTLTARTYAGKATDSVRLVIGDGDCTAEYYLWAGGNNEHKKMTITPVIKASNWTDSKGKTKNGKIVWLASDSDIDIEFDKAKHTVKSKPAKTRISVDSKGVVTAKKPGLAYVYICDTGSCTYELHTVGVLTAPGKLVLVNKPGSTAKNDMLKTVGLNAGSTGVVYITPTSSLGEPEPESTYTVSLAKDEYAAYVSVSDVYETESGYACFKVTARDFDRAKTKIATVKINVVNNESGKKASLTVKIGNPVDSIETSIKLDISSDGNATGIVLNGNGSAATLASKNDTVTLKLNLLTYFGNGIKTTDKFKLYVGKTTVAMKSNGKGVEADKGATVSAAIVKNSADGSTMEVVLKAKKEAGTPAVIYGAVTDALTKKVTLYELADVTAEGEVIIP